HRRRTAARGHKNRRSTESLLGDGRDRTDQWRIGGATVGMLAFLRAELDVAEASPVEMRTQQRGDLHRVLVGNQTEVDLPGRFGGDDRLRSRPVVARLDATHVARWLEHGRPLGFVVRAPKGEALDADDL